MTTNLRITRESINAKDPSNTTGKITSTDSNVSTDYLIPASSSPWQTSGTATSELNKQLVHYAENETNGANYTWCAATAGTCLQGTDEEVKDKDAPASICPRGWRLPTIDEYTALKGKGTSKVDSNTSDSVFDGWNIGSGFFPAAGRVYDGSLNDVGSYGYYWSSTAYSSTSAYHLYFNSSSVYTSNYYNFRYFGYSVRCIAL